MRTSAVNRHGCDVTYSKIGTKLGIDNFKAGTDVGEYTIEIPYQLISSGSLLASTLIPPSLSVVFPSEDSNRAALRDVVSVKQREA